MRNVKTCNRRQAIKTAAGGVLAGANLMVRHRGARAAAPPESEAGVVIGEPTAARVGIDVLKTGGNAIDACVAAALAAGVVAPHQCGIGGYGGHMTIGLAQTNTVTSIDFNSMAPAAASRDMYPAAEDGSVPGNIHFHGWLAAGVPGTLAGLQLALDRYGTRSFGQLVQPAFRFARDGFVVGSGLARAIRSAAGQFSRDPASARLFLPNGQPLNAGAEYRNPELAKMLQTLARRDSSESFYRGDIGEQIAQGFAKGGGLVTADDMAAYRAAEVEPVTISWRGDTVHTAPLTAGGTTALEALSILKAFGLNRDPSDAAQTHARLEILRVAWNDRLTLFGDPQHVSVPVDLLLSDDYAKGVADRVRRAVDGRKPLPLDTKPRWQSGTVHLSAADVHGNMVALTLTHGAGFGARVTVPGLGLILGHGMSRFDLPSDHPNCPGPRKRPLNNMCPTVLLREGVPVLALGGAGGRKIPNAIFEVLAQYVGQGAPIAQAMAAPRLHTEGDLAPTLDSAAPEAHLTYLKQAGYRATRRSSALVSTVSYDPASGRCQALRR